MKQITFLLLAAFLLPGCSLTSLTKEGEQVRVLKTDPKGCRYMGEVTAYLQDHKGQMDLFGAAGMERDQRDVWVKNEAGKIGGNAIVSVFSDAAANIQFTIHAVYNCRS